MLVDAEEQAAASYEGAVAESRANDGKGRVLAYPGPPGRGALCEAGSSLHKSHLLAVLSEAQALVENAGLLSDPPPPAMAGVNPPATVLAAIPPATVVAPGLVAPAPPATAAPLWRASSRRPPVPDSSAMVGTSAAGACPRRRRRPGGRGPLTRLASPITGPGSTYGRWPGVTSRPDRRPLSQPRVLA